MRIRHFDPKLVGREEKAAPVTLKLVASKERSAIFEAGGRILNAGLVRLSYSRPSDDTLVVTLEKGARRKGSRSAAGS